MTHFGEGDWADFVRGLPINDAPRMMAHLTICADCNDFVSALRAVEDVHRRDIVREPPAHVVHKARLIFPASIRRG